MGCLKLDILSEVYQPLAVVRDETVSSREAKVAQMWLSVDPLAVYNPVFEVEHYFDGQHNGGVFNSGNLAPYMYCYQNPIKYIDPNGKQVQSIYIGGPVLVDRMNKAGEFILDATKGAGKTALNLAANTLSYIYNNPNFEYMEGQNAEPVDLNGVYERNQAALNLLNPYAQIEGFSSTVVEGGFGIANSLYNGDGQQFGKAALILGLGINFSKGKTIGLGLDIDLPRHRGTGAITYKLAGWQQAGLTKVNWGRASVDDYYFFESFKESVKNAGAINFNVSNFDPYYPKPKVTNQEFNYIINNPSLLQKTTFIQNSDRVFWNGKEFVK
ncbi:MAG: hypothetical protein R2798_05955 [Chitinophagales bacterium]